MAKPCSFRARNGAGKSTLLRTLAGLLQPAGGRVVYGLADDEVRGVETVHYLGYEDGLKPSLTVGENLDFWAAMLAAPLPTQLGLARVEHSEVATSGKPDFVAGREPSAVKDTMDPHPCPSPEGGRGACERCRGALAP